MKRQATSTLISLAWWICFTCLVHVGYGQSIRTNIDRKDILIGEQINYTLQFVLPSTGYQVEFNVPDSLPHFEILNKTNSDSTDKDGNILVTQRIVFTSWDSGQWTLPSVPMKIRTPGNQAVYSLNADPITINVGYMPIDSTGLPRDIKPVMGVFYIEPNWIWIAVGILLALILAFVLYRYFKKRPKKQKPVFDSSLNAYDEAMQALKALNDRSVSLPAETKKYYTDLSNIFKHYYSRRHQRNLLNLTSTEILMRLNSDEVNRESIAGLADALRSADAVKFAKYQPTLTENRGHLQQIESCIVAMEKLNFNQNQNP